MWILIITLIIVGLLLMGVEMLVIPGFGVIGILGALSFIASIYLAFTSMGTVMGLVIVGVELLLIILFVALLLRSKTWKKITLNTNISSKVDESPAGKGVVVGARGVALTRLAPGGNGEFDGKSLEVFSRDTLIEAGSEIEISDIEDNRVFVKEIKE